MSLPSRKETPRETHAILREWSRGLTEMTRSYFAGAPTEAKDSDLGADSLALRVIYRKRVASEIYS
jgi:hypothetical protein